MVAVTTAIEVEGAGCGADVTSEDIEEEEDDDDDDGNEDEDDDDSDDVGNNEFDDTPVVWSSLVDDTVGNDSPVGRLTEGKLKLILIGPIVKRSGRSCLSTIASIKREQRKKKGSVRFSWRSNGELAWRRTWKKEPDGATRNRKWSEGQPSW
jgi:hypothetical protein